MFDKDASMSISISTEEFSESHHMDLKYAIGGSYKTIIYPEHQVGNDNAILDTRRIFGDVPPREDRYSIIWIFKCHGTIGIRVQLLRPNETSPGVDNTTWVTLTTLRPGEWYYADRGRTNDSGFSLRFDYFPLDGRQFNAIPQEERRAGYVEVSAIVIDWDSVIPDA